MRRIPVTAIVTSCAVWLLLSGPAAAVSPSPKTFVIASAAPMEAVAIETLSPKNAQQRRFMGPAGLRLSGGSTLPLAAHLEHKRKRDRGLYRLRSTAAGFPKFRGTILTQGEPESVTGVRLVLVRGRGDKVKETQASNLTIAPASTTTTLATTSTTIAVSVSTTTTSTPTTTTGTPTTTLMSGCFQDRGDGTIRDTCTGLQWEKKETRVGSTPDPSNVHDVDNRYTWAGSCSSSGDQCQPNAAAAATCAVNTGGGTLGCDECAGAPCDVDPSGLGAITTVWDWLNQVNAANFAGHDDWRLPSAGGSSSFQTDSDELATILLAPYPPCRASPCIDPIFGPTDAGGYWSATTSPMDPRDALIVFFRDGDVNDFPKTLLSHVRAVRSGP